MWVTAWFAATSASVVDPSFYEDGRGVPTTITAERYNQISNTFFFPELQRLNLTGTWIQQDGAASYAAKLLMITLRANFSRCFILRFGDIHWPSRLSNLTQGDYFL